MRKFQNGQLSEKIYLDGLKLEFRIRIRITDDKSILDNNFLR